MTTATTGAALAGPALDRTALERHAAFFDPESTGEIKFGQTLEGMRRLGVRRIWRVLLPPLIHGFLGSITQGRPSLVIRIDRIARGKHPYDSGVFDAKGQFDPIAFDALFAGLGDAIAFEEMRAVISARGNRLPDRGKTAGVLGHWFSGKEVAVLFCIAADATKKVNGRDVPALSRKTLHRFYEGTLFPEIARRHALVAAGCVVPRHP